MLSQFRSTAELTGLTRPWHGWAARAITADFWVTMKDPHMTPSLPALSFTLCTLLFACTPNTPSTGGTSNGGQTASAGNSSGGAQSESGTGGSGLGGGVNGGSSNGGAGAAGASAGFGCAGKTYKLCEDFESGTEGGLPTNWTALKSWGPSDAVGLAKDQFHSGAMALKTSSAATGAGRIQHALAAFGATATKHWGRLFYKVQTPAPIGANGAYYHVTFAALEGTDENRVVDTVEDPNGKIQYLFNVPDDSCCDGSPYNWSHDGAWHCAEWHVDVSAQSYQFFIDGTEVTSIGFTGKAAAKMSTYTALGVGPIFYVAPTGPFTAWIDDLAVDDQKIGCQ